MQTGLGADHDENQQGSQQISICISMSAAKPLENNTFWQAFRHLRLL